MAKSKFKVAIFFSWNVFHAKYESNETDIARIRGFSGHFQQCGKYAIFIEN